jgi:hypothetical protein
MGGRIRAGSVARFEEMEYLAMRYHGASESPRLFSPLTPIAIFYGR